MQADTALSLLVPLVILGLLWTLVRHWVLPFVLGFALAVALGPQARPLMAGAWEGIANLGRMVFGAPQTERDFGRPVGRDLRDGPDAYERRRGSPEGRDGYERWPDEERR